VDPAVLIVAWFMLGQPPAGYRVEFDTGEACTIAAAKLIEETANLWEQLPNRLGVPPQEWPRLSAKCRVEE
jgi:hypothetical protein